MWLVIIVLVSTALYFSTIIHRKDHSKDLLKKSYGLISLKILWEILWKRLLSQITRKEILVQSGFGIYAVRLSF